MQSIKCNMFNTHNEANISSGYSVCAATKGNLQKLAYLRGVHINEVWMSEMTGRRRHRVWSGKQWSIYGSWVLSSPSIWERLILSSTFAQLPIFVSSLLWKPCTSTDHIFFIATMFVCFLNLCNYHNLLFFYSYKRRCSSFTNCLWCVLLFFSFFSFFFLC